MIKKNPQVWQLQTAKNKFSEVVNLAMEQGPQMVTRSGKPAVYVISASDYDRLSGKSDKALKELLLNPPCKGVDLEIERGKSTLKDLEL